MTNCNIEFRDATLAGISFEIQSSGHEFENERINTFEFPLTDLHYNQKMGSSPVTFSINGFVHGVNARDLYQLAENTWIRGLDTQLFYPGPNKTYDVTVVSCKFNDDGKTLNKFAFTVDLIETANDPYPGSLLEGFLNNRSSSNSFVSSVTSFFSNNSNSFDNFNRAKTELSTDARTFTSGATLVNLNTSVNQLSYNSQDKTSVIQSVISSVSIGSEVPSFLKSASVARSEDVEQVSFSLAALNEYFNLITANDLCWGELREFRNSALALKSLTNDQDVKNSIDDLILNASRSATNLETETIQGTYNALVLSDQLYGSISRASEIMELSGAVSGAAIVNPVYYKT